MSYAEAPLRLNSHNRSRLERQDLLQMGAKRLTLGSPQTRQNTERPFLSEPPDGCYLSALNVAAQGFAMNKMQAALHRRCKSFPSIHHSATGHLSNPRRWSAIKRRGMLAVSGDRREETVSRLHPAATQDTRDERPARFVTSAHNAARLTPTRQVATGRRNMERAGGKREC